MAKDINVVQCKLVGISCLEDGVRERVLSEWNKQFHSHDAFWVDVEENQTAAVIARNITDMISGQGIVSLAGETLVVAVFLDLTKAPQEAKIKEIVEVPQKLNSVLGCNVPITLEFGYLAKMAFADTRDLQNNVNGVIQINRLNTRLRKQLCLVAVSPLIQEKNDHSWKSVITLLDVLRREASPADIVPVVNVAENTSVGFIRYGEYNEEVLTTLLTRKEQLLTKLGDRGEMELFNILNNAKAELVSDIDRTYVVDGNFQPIHPDMRVDGFFAKKSAARGRNDKYESARHSTWAAMEQTAQRLQQMIQDAYAEQIQSAADYLDGYIAKAGVGIDLEADRNRMCAILEVEKSNMTKPMAPALTYTESGCAIEIESYLRDIRRYTAQKVKKEYAEALLKAYKDRPASYFENKKSAINVELEKNRIQLSCMMNKTDLINTAAMGAALPETSFHPILGGGAMTRFILCRNSQDSSDCDNICVGSMTTVYHVDERYGGLKVIDNAPIKALQLLMFESSQHLSDLIK